LRLFPSSDENMEGSCRVRRIDVFPVAEFDEKWLVGE
jgi:hypothetical protein